jgi:hypothetical protein
LRRLLLVPNFKSLPKAVLGEKYNKAAAQNHAGDSLHGTTQLSFGLNTQAVSKTSDAGSCMQAV